MGDQSDGRDREHEQDLRGVLHDVSNALTVILGWAQQARMPGVSPDRIHRALRVIEEQTRVARVLARRAVGVRETELAGALEELLLGLKDTFAIEADKRSVKLALGGLEHSAWIARPSDAFWVLSNLVLNAIAFSPVGKTVDVVLAVDGDVASVTVRDQGGGVPLEIQEKIFDGGVSLRAGGSGNGLRHARALARSAGGDLAFVPGESGDVGARFCLSWPIAPVEPEPESREPSRFPLGLRVLILEDDERIVELVSSALVAQGAVVDVVRSYAEIATRPSPTLYDVVLVDLSPIVHDIDSALTELRRRANRVVVVTGASLESKGVRMAPEDVVQKPFELDELVRIVGRTIK